jgi:leucyl/phenylalanyl-tRNA---protein transferase
MKPIPLTPRVLEFAYRQGYFPMNDPDTGETNWYRPDPRAVLPLERFHVSHSLRRKLRKLGFRISYNTAFAEVMQRCAERDEGTWISEEFLDAYTALHKQSKAHCVEVWENEALVGGVYGIALGGAFFAESMFHRKTDASKIALFHLVSRLKTCGYALLEVQFLTPHLESLGAIEITDEAYGELLKKSLELRVGSFVLEELYR